MLRNRLLCRIVLSALFVFGIIEVRPDEVAAVACGPPNNASGTTRYGTNFSSTPAFTGCTQGVPVGAATHCSVGTGGGGNWVARWVSTVARTGDSTGGCDFACNQGTCQVKRDGLPAELVYFGVD